MLTPPLDRAWIAAHIPHQGDMCLLDTVLQWDAEQVLCSAGSHRLAHNPLRVDGRLGAACGIEYAAQAMAVHGALLAGRDGPPRAGMLVSARQVCWNVTRLDDIAEDLQVRAVCRAADASALHYAFSLHAGGRLLLGGQAMVVQERA